MQMSWKINLKIYIVMCILIFCEKLTLEKNIVYEPVSIGASGSVGTALEEWLVNMMQQKKKSRIKRCTGQSSALWLWSGSAHVRVPQVGNSPAVHVIRQRVTDQPLVLSQEITTAHTQTWLHNWIRTRLHCNNSHMYMCDLLTCVKLDCLIDHVLDPQIFL